VTRRHRARRGVGIAALVALPLTGGAVAMGGALARPAVAATSTICVGEVVDPTDGPGSTRGPDHTCVTVPSGASGLDVLDARASSLGRPAPRLGDGGLVCAIDGYPTSGCAPDDPGGGYDYWTYWHRARGASGWSYSTKGADGYRPAAGDEEGWAWQQGGPEGARKPPLVDPAVVCPSTSAAPATSTAAAASHPAPVASRTAAPAATRRSSSSAAPSRSTARPTVLPRTGARSAVAGTASAATSRQIAPTTGTATTGTATTGTATTGTALVPATSGHPTAAAGGRPSPSTGPSAPPATVASLSTGPAVPAPAAASPASVPVAVRDVAQRRGGGGLPLGAILGGVGIAALGGAAAVRARRTRA